MEVLRLTESMNTVRPAISNLLASVDSQRQEASASLDHEARSVFGQYMTPLPVARLMASMVRSSDDDVSILDAGAGIGTLSAALVEELCRRQRKPHRIHLTAYEIDPALIRRLRETMDLCARKCRSEGISFESEVRTCDFIADTANRLGGGLFSEHCSPEFTIAIQNPPYRKIHADSIVREQLRRIGIETSNLYTGFLAATLQRLRPGGELVAITPRSFCNGPYFRPFREFLLKRAPLHAIHLFDSRQTAFQDDSVLQETIILRAVAAAEVPDVVTISSSPDADADILTRTIPYREVVRPSDRELFIHIVQDGLSSRIVERMERFDTTLADLGLTVSTGRVVDFRAKPYLREKVGEDTVPLIYPGNLDAGRVVWPKASRKPVAIVDCPATDDQLVPSEHYVLVKRFTSKEERRRIVAAVYDPTVIAADHVGFENHLNYFHVGGHGFDPVFARGLAAYLNSTLVDAFFRQFNGHTQVNATDLRNIRYPTCDQLMALGARIGENLPGQVEVDAIFTEVLMADEPIQSDPVAAKKKIEEATQVLIELGLPRAQLNERSALTLLSLLNLTPEKAWPDAEPTLIGITPMMDFMKTYYGKEYAPNTRETIRRQTVHQFVQAALTLENPDDPTRPTNSPKTVYRIERSALDLLKSFGSSSWAKNLRKYQSAVPALKVRYAQAREAKRIPITLPAGVTIMLSPGGQNDLIERIMGDFAEIFTPGGKPLYVGDTAEKYAYYDQAALANLGISIESHGKMPDVIIHDSERDWLVLIEAVTSHGPINPKRHKELKDLFAGCRIGLVLVTAFSTRKTMVKYLSEISWETEVWIAESPDHLIHFNGERYMGPYT